MGGYARTGPFISLSAPGLDAPFLNKVEAVLSRPSGDTETGKYFAAGAVYTSGALVNCYIPTISRSATPVSLTVDTADVSPQGGMSSPATAQLTASGFQVYSLSTTGPNVNARTGGNYTVHYRALPLFAEKFSEQP